MAPYWQIAAVTEDCPAVASDSPAQVPDMLCDYTLKVKSPCIRCCSPVKVARSMHRIPYLEIAFGNSICDHIIHVQAPPCMIIKLVLLKNLVDQNRDSLCNLGEWAITARAR